MTQVKKTEIMEERVVLIDTDAGLDDAMAILMTIKAHKSSDIPFRIVGITCVDGNTKVDNVTRNVTRILEIMNESTIPIFRGASESMITPFEVKNPYHGKDGFGDTDFPEIQAKLETEHAVNAIIRLAHQYSEKLTILALGPLTNLAMAVRMDPTISKVVRDVYLMGGNIEGAGNCSLTAEFNFAYDPEAAFITLSAFTCPIVIVPLEVAENKIVQTYDWRVTELGISSINTVESCLINKIEAANLISRHKLTGKWTSYDSTVAAALIEPKIITKMINHYCTIELYAQHSRGQMIVDYLPHLKPPGNISIITDMDKSLFQKMLKWAIGGPCPL